MGSLTIPSGTLDGILGGAAAPSGTLTLSLIASGTLSGSSLTLSSLSSYDTLILMVYNVNQSNSAQLRFRVNNNSTSNYWTIGYAQTGSATDRYINAGDAQFQTNDNVGSGANGNEIVYVLNHCKAAGFTEFAMSGSYYNGSARVGESTSSGVYAVAEAVSSIVLAPTAGTFNGGNYRIYGG